MRDEAKPKHQVERPTKLKARSQPKAASNAQGHTDPPTVYIELAFALEGTEVTKAAEADHSSDGRE